MNTCYTVINKATAMSAPIKSVNFAAHGAIGETLTDRQIEEYMLRGRYGQDKCQEILDDIRHGRIRRFDSRIKAGEFGDRARAALKERRRRTPKGGYGKKIPVMLSEEQIAALAANGIDINALWK